MELFVDAAWESLYKAGEELCGDKVEFVRGDDFFLAVLADGLGSGVEANILSTLTSKIIATMLSEGASLQDAVETIASTLPVCRERGVAYSTFTIIQVDKSGMISTAEYDNPTLVYLKNGVITPFERTQTTIGGKEVYVSHFQGETADMLVAFSDGVVHAGVGRLLDLGWQYDNIVNYIGENVKPNQSPRAFTRNLLLAVNALYMQKPGDDSTVCTLLLKPSRPACIMVESPVNSELDAAVVRRLVTFPGYKIVCGGTTSQIVSKQTGRELTVSLDYENPAIPTAHIQGIDLITEAVLTVGKALDLVKNCISADPESWDNFTLTKKDGASQLAKLLLEDCTEVQFLVGRALNPAHQNPGMPVSLGLKLNLIKELAAVLEQGGKGVTVEYF